MSIFVQEELGLYKRNKRKTSLQLDSQKDWFQFGRLYNNASIGNPGYQPRMEPFILKLGDLKCNILQNVVLQNGTATVDTFPFYASPSGSCATLNTSIADSPLKRVVASNGLNQLVATNMDRMIIDRPSSVTSGDPEYNVSQDGTFKVSMGWDDDGVGHGFLYNWAGDGWRIGAQGNNPVLEIITTAGNVGAEVSGKFKVTGATTLGNALADSTRINGFVLDSAGSQAGAANRVLRSNADGQLIWSDDDPVVALPQGNIWLGNVDGIQSPLAPGAAGQLIVSNGTTLTYESITADSAGPQDGVIVSSAGGSPIKVGLTIKTLPNMGVNVVDADSLVIYDASADANKQVTVTDFMDSIDVPDGSGTANKITKWIDADTIGDSGLTDDGNALTGDAYGSITFSTTAGVIDIDAAGNLELDSASGIQFQASNPTVKTSFRCDVEIYNNKKLGLGTGGGHMELFHDATDSHIVNNSGTLIIKQNVNDGDIVFENDDGTGNTTTYFRLNGSDVKTSFSKDTKHLDDVKALFGSNNDLQIYHGDGTPQSWIRDVGTNDLILDTNGAQIALISDGVVNNGKMALFKKDGAVELYYDNAKKIETTNTGFSITGNANFADNGKALFGDNDDLEVYHGGGNSIINNKIGNLNIVNEHTGSNIKVETADGSGADITLRSADGLMALFQNLAGVELYYNGTKSAVVRDDGFELAAGKKYSLNQLNTAPSSATDTGRLGEIRYTADYIYVCVATNQWKRVALSTW